MSKLHIKIFSKSFYRYAQANGLLPLLFSGLKIVSIAEEKHFARVWVKAIK